MEWVRRLNWALVAVALALVCIGVAAIAGDSGTGPLEGLGRKQAFWGLVSLVILVLVLVPHYRVYQRVAYAVFALTLPLLVLLLVARWVPFLDRLMPIVNGSRRWIRLGAMQLQPSELAKIAYICALARYLMFRENYRTFKGLIGPFALTLVPIALILRQPDLGTALVFVPVLFAVLFAAGARVRHLLIITVLGAATLPALWVGVMSSEQKSRILGWLHQSDHRRPADDAGYHLWQSKLALGSGGLSGSQEKTDSWVGLGYLPEAQTDFIFAVIGESWGFVGCATVVVLFWLLCMFGLGIAGKTREPFGRLVAVGVVTLFASQLLINVGMTIGLMPITGMTLPFVSYGGSSLLSSFVALGILLSIGARRVLVIAPEAFSFRDD